MIKLKDIKHLPGSLLVSPPVKVEDHWTKAVVMIIQHQQDHTMGIVLNRSSNIKLRELGAKANCDIKYNVPVYDGGMCNEHSFSMIHSSEWSCNNTYQLNPWISISSDLSILSRLSKKDSPRDWRIFMGNVLWLPEQLEMELNGIEPFDHQRWCHLPFSYQLVFKHTQETQWAKCIEQVSTTFSQNFLSQVLAI